MKAVDHTNKKYNYLLCIKKAETKKKTTFWTCLCDCGKYFDTRISGVIRGLTKSCGCKKWEIVRKARSLPIDICALNCIYRNTRKRAKTRKQAFDLSVSEFKVLIDSNCFYCKKIPSNILTYRNFIYYHSGLDRIKSELGYTINNVVPCCKRCNGAKNDMTVKEFKEHITILYNNFCIDKIQE